MPTTRKQKIKARKSREGEMLSDVENINIMLGSKHFEREDREFGDHRNALVLIHLWIIIPKLTLLLVKRKSRGLPEMAKTQEKLILVVR